MVGLIGPSGSGKTTIVDLILRLFDPVNGKILLDGKDIRNVVNSMNNPMFVLGDHIGVKSEDEEIIMEFAKEIICVSPLSLQADQCIVIVHYELDRLQI